MAKPRLDSVALMADFQAEAASEDLDKIRPVARVKTQPAPLPDSQDEPTLSNTTTLDAEHSEEVLVAIEPGDGGEVMVDTAPEDAPETTQVEVSESGSQVVAAVASEEPATSEELPKAEDAAEEVVQAGKSTRKPSGKRLSKDSSATLLATVTARQDRGNGARHKITVNIPEHLELALSRLEKDTFTVTRRKLSRSAVLCEVLSRLPEDGAGVERLAEKGRHDVGPVSTISTRIPEEDYYRLLDATFLTEPSTPYTRIVTGLLQEVLEAVDSALEDVRG